MKPSQRLPSPLEERPEATAEQILLADWTSHGVRKDEPFRMRSRPEMLPVPLQVPLESFNGECA